MLGCFFRLDTRWRAPPPGRLLPPAFPRICEGIRPNHALAIFLINGERRHSMHARGAQIMLVHNIESVDSTATYVERYSLMFPLVKGGRLMLWTVRRNTAANCMRRNY